MHVAMGMLTQMILAERVLAYGNLKAEASLETEFTWKLSLPQANQPEDRPKIGVCCTAAILFQTFP